MTEREAAAASARPLPPTLDLTLTSLELCNIAAFAGNDDADGDEIVRLLIGPGHSGYGLYAASPDYPQEGAVLIKAIAASAPQAVRMLTKAELMGLACIYHECNIDPEAAIRKFCEVNGLGIVPLAPQDTGEKS